MTTTAATRKRTPTKRKATKRQQALRDFKDMGEVLKGIFDDVRVHVHLGAMEFKADAGPYLDEVRAASNSARRDLSERAAQLRTQLKRIRAAHRAS